MIYLVCALLLSVLMLFYFKIASKYNIVDRPNERSSHTIITLRGGGIVFWFAALFYFLLNTSTKFFFVGISLISLVSFCDDIKSLSSKLRISIQFIALSIIFYDLDIFHLLPWWLIVIAFVFSIGIINAYNFMDGINGITGLYTIAVFLPLCYVNTHIITFIDQDFLIFPILASLAFLFFNFRIKAKCFAGDIGSISIAFWLIYVLMTLILQSKDIIWISFLAVYGVDSVCTIIYRLSLKQNILQPHRLHLYQLLSNDYKIDHRIVSLLYALLQLGVTSVTLLLYKNINTHYILIIIYVPLSLIYVFSYYLVTKNKK